MTKPENKTSEECHIHSLPWARGMTVRFWGVKNNTVTKYPLVCDVNAMEKMHAYD